MSKVFWLSEDTQVIDGVMILHTHIGLDYKLEPQCSPDCVDCCYDAAIGTSFRINDSGELIVTDLEYSGAKVVLNLGLV